MSKDEVMEMLSELFDNITAHLITYHVVYPTKDDWAKYVKKYASEADDETTLDSIQETGSVPDDAFFETTKSITSIIIDESWKALQIYKLQNGIE